MTESVAAASACRKLIFSGGCRGVDRGADQGVDGLVDREQRPHLLGDALRVFATRTALPAPMSVLWCPITVSHPHRIGSAQARSSARGLDVEQVGDQAEQLRGVLLTAPAPPPAGWCARCLDDPPVIGGPSAFAAGQHGQVGAVGQHGDGGQRERRRGPPRMCAPWPARRRPGCRTEVQSASTSIPRRTRTAVPGQGLLADGVGPDRRPDQRPGARLGRPEPPDLQERPGPVAFDSRPK